MKVFIGMDPRQKIPAFVLAHSIQERASKPVSITFLRLNQLPIQRRGLTEFTFTRFLVPHLCEYQGVGVFLDADMLVDGDICELETLAKDQPDSDVLVATSAPRFEWPAVMVFNNENCKRLTPEYVDDDANQMFDFAWAANIGNLPPEWHHVVGYEQPPSNPKLLHYTCGTPCWPEVRNLGGYDKWHDELREMNFTVSWLELMGQSVHVNKVLTSLDGHN